MTSTRTTTPITTINNKLTLTIPKLVVLAL
jgi:hypothetical protein